MSKKRTGYQQKREQQKDGKSLTCFNMNRLVLSKLVRATRGKDDDDSEGQHGNRSEDDQSRRILPPFDPLCHTAGDREISYQHHIISSHP